MKISRRHVLQRLGAGNSGSTIGRIEGEFTVPLGINAKIDADSGRVALLEEGDVSTSPCAAL